MKKTLFFFVVALVALSVYAANTVVEQATDILIRNTANVPGLEILKGTNQTNPYIVAGTQSSQVFSVGSTGLVTAVSFSGDGSQLTGLSGENSIANLNGKGTNTTFYSSAIFNTNVLVVTNSNVGFGTNSPQYGVHVYGASNDVIQAVCENGSSSANSQTQWHLLTPTSSGSIVLTPADSVALGAPGLFLFSDSRRGEAGPVGIGRDTTVSVYVTTNNTVGVGTTSAEAKLEVAESTGSKVFQINGGNDLSGNAIKNYWLAADTTTSDATPSNTGAFVPIEADKTYLVEARVTARRTGGTAGTADDGAAYVLRGAYKTATGTVTLIGSVAQDFVAESQAGWNATLVISGTSVYVQVTGAVDNDISWHVMFTVQATEG